MTHSAGIVAVTALQQYDDNGSGRITCAEARRHGIAPGRAVDEVASEYRVPSRFSDFRAPAETVRAIMGHIYNNR